MEERTADLIQVNERLRTEVAEHQRVAEALRESYSLLNAVVEGTSDVVFVKDLQGRYLIAQVLFTPLLAGWSIWVGIAISSRSSDIRVAQQVGAIAGHPAIAVAYLISFNVIHATLGLALALAAVLLIVDGLGWRLVSAVFDRERLITGTRWMRRGEATGQAAKACR